MFLFIYLALILDICVLSGGRVLVSCVCVCFNTILQPRSRRFCCGGLPLLNKQPGNTWRWCLQRRERQRKRGRERVERQGIHFLTSSRNSRGIFKESYSQNVRHVAEHNMRRRSGCYPAASWRLSYSLVLFSFSASLTKRTASALAANREKRDSKGGAPVRQIRVVRFLPSSSGSWHGQRPRFC